MKSQGYDQWRYFFCRQWLMHQDRSRLCVRYEISPRRLSTSTAVPPATRMEIYHIVDCSAYFMGRCRDRSISTYSDCEADGDGSMRDKGCERPNANGAISRFLLFSACVNRKDELVRMTNFSQTTPRRQVARTIRENVQEFACQCHFKCHRHSSNGRKTCQGKDEH